MSARTQTDRLRKLRTRLDEMGLAAFVVPKSDEHQLEYVPDSSDRLFWLTEFSGSAGLAVVCRDAAGLFTDGRYTEQALRQTNSPEWDHRHISREPPEDWLAQHVGADDTVGYDPRVHTPASIAWIERSAAVGGFTIQQVDSNPLDAIWDDRPAPPCAEVELFPESIAGRSAAQKRTAMAAELRDAGMDALIISDPASLAWLLNVRGGDLAHTPFTLGFAILGSDGGVHVFADPRKWPAAVKEPLVAGGPAETLFSPLEALPAALAAWSGRSVRTDERSATEWINSALRDGGATVDIGTDPCTLAKACKTAPELEAIRAAHVTDGASLTRFLHWLDENTPGGYDEWALVERLAAFREEGEGYRFPSFRTISAFGANGASPHYTVERSIAATLKEGSLYLVDSGGQYLGGTTDITRVVAIGTPTNEMRLRYTQVLRGHIALSCAQFPQGITGSQLDPLARQYLWAAGVDFDHGTGHGVGCYLSVHEGPQSISKRHSTVALLPGMVVSNEPGYYKPGHFGIRIENLVTVRELDPQPDNAESRTLGFETLSLAPYDRRLIVTSMLREDERAWVDAYHARVCEVLTPRLPAEAARWLERVTTPLED
jgi:Xaa-Pro aminopeptidase